jgi:hypothetical protein
MAAWPSGGFFYGRVAARSPKKKNELRGVDSGIFLSRHGGR